MENFIFNIFFEFLAKFLLIKAVIFSAKIREKTLHKLYNVKGRYTEMHFAHAEERRKEIVASPRMRPLFSFLQLFRFSKLVIRWPSG